MKLKYFGNTNVVFQRKAKNNLANLEVRTSVDASVTTDASDESTANHAHADNSNIKMKNTAI